MLSLYEDSTAYVLAEQMLLGDAYEGMAASQESRANHFIDSVRSLSQDVTDSSRCQIELAKDTRAFSPEQRRRMGLAVAAHMRGEGMPNTSSGKPKLQEHLYIHNYLTEKKWAAYYDKEVQWVWKTEDAAEFCMSIGLRNPNDATVKTLLAILSIAHRRAMDPEESFAEILKFKDKMRAVAPFHPGEQSCLRFPEHVSKFMRLHRNVYLECDPPIESRLDEKRIRMLTRKDLMPSMNTNKATTG